MNESRAQILLSFVQRNFGTRSSTPITLDTPLLGEKVIDSMGLTLLAAFIEEEFGVIFDGTELRRDRLESVRALTVYLDRRS